jgi:hypothetical protein
MRISVLARGGLAVYGGHYDPHCNAACFAVRDGEGVQVTVEYPGAPTTPSVAVSGLSASAPAISGNKVSLTLTAVQGGGYADLSAIVGGVTRTIRIRARTPETIDRYNDCERV